MTTIAWDGNMLAADRLVAYRGGRMGAVAKIARRESDGALIGSCGSLPLCQALHRWFIAGEEGDPPKMEYDKDNFASGFIVRQCGAIDHITSVGMYRVEALLYALGSGADYALGAMSIGADARRAVEVASQWDNSTGGGVDVLFLADENARELQERVRQAVELEKIA